LALERQADHKSEYLNGRMFAMSGASLAHNRIVADVANALQARLRGGPCEVLVGDMRVKVSATGLYSYPDAVVVCGEVELEDEERDTLLNPVVIVEVLSRSTEAYDRGAKFGHYRQLPSLQGYVLIAQHCASVEVFSRQGDRWVLTVASDLAETIRVPALDLSLPLQEVYARVTFPEPEADQPRPADT
jgi:Uma2 family endonuclease